MRFGRKSDAILIGAVTLVCQAHRGPRLKILQLRVAAIVMRARSAKVARRERTFAVRTRGFAAAFAADDEEQRRSHMGWPWPALLAIGGLRYDGPATVRK